MEKSPCFNCPDETPTCRGECPRPAAWADATHDYGYLTKESPFLKSKPMDRAVKHPIKPEDCIPKRAVFNMNMESNGNHPYYMLIFQEAQRQGVSMQQVVMQCICKVITLSTSEIPPRKVYPAMPVGEKPPKRAVFNMNMESRVGMPYYNLLLEEAHRQGVTVQKIVMQCVKKVIFIGENAA